MGGPGAGGPERLVGGGKGLQGWARGVEGIRRMGHASDGPQPHASRLIVRPNRGSFTVGRASQDMFHSNSFCYQCFLRTYKK